MLEAFKKPEIKNLLFKGEIGLEKENIRIKENGYLSLTPHKFGNKATHPFIRTDFSESQAEIGTVVCANTDEVYGQLENLHDVVSTSIATENDELLWPLSNPPLFISEMDIPIAKYDDEYKESEIYRVYLSGKYGKKLMLYSGIHYNYSFNKALIPLLHKEIDGVGDEQGFKNWLYMRLAKNCYIYSWFPVLMTAASPIFHESFMDKGEKVGGGRFLGYSSMRNSQYGYWNKHQMIVDYASLDSYITSIVNMVRSGELYSTAELYTPVRLKPRGKYLMKNLAAGGVNHLELRMFDLNPLDKNGMNKEDMMLVEYWLIFLTAKDDFDYDESTQRLSLQNHFNSAAFDIDGVSIKYEGKEASLREAGLDLISQMEEFYRELDYPKALETLERAKERLLHPEKLYSHIIYEDIKRDGYIKYGVTKALEYLAKSNDTYYLLRGFEDMELSTQAVLKACLKLGVEYEVLDRIDNFLRLTKDGRVEYVKQATKTSRDSCASVLIMRNKHLTKQLLHENGLNTPSGEIFSEIEEARAAYERFKGKRFVVKPNFSNFGMGITVFKLPPTESHYLWALNLAFRHSREVIVEEFISGDDYRFLVIGGTVRAVNRRIPANVTGDGVSTIRELIDKKSKDPLRGDGHRKPLAIIRAGEEEAMHLRVLDMNFDTVLEDGRKIFLRQNANISTGGDTIGCMSIVHPSFFDIAVKAAKAVDAVFCGVDIISEDITAKCNGSNYSITELNFNPSIKMHCFPTEGEGMPIGETVVKYLFDL